MLAFYAKERALGTPVPDTHDWSILNRSLRGWFASTSSCGIARESGRRTGALTVSAGVGGVVRVLGGGEEDNLGIPPAGRWSYRDPVRTFFKDTRKDFGIFCVFEGATEHRCQIV